jgi:hypothetical protein
MNAEPEANTDTPPSVSAADAADAVSPTPTPPLGVVVHSLPCIKCWYDLRTLSKRDRCPECGTPVSRTVRSLFASDHRYLRRVRAKLDLAYLALPVGVGVMAAVSFASTFLGVFGWSSYLVPLALIPLPMVMAAFGLVGFVRLEDRLPRRIEHPGHEPSPAWAVWLTVACMTLFIASVVLVSMPALEGFSAFPIMLGILTPVLWTARNAVLAPHLKRLSRRLGVRHRPMLSVYIALAAMVATFFTIMGFMSRSFASLLLLPVAAGLALWAIAHLMHTIGMCRRRIDAVLRFRASMGKIRPRSAG